MLTNVKIFVRLEVMLYVCIRKQLKYIIMKTYIQKKIEKLMQTSTGKAMCDSGGENGRHWQRNKSKKLDFNDDVKLDEYGATIPIHVYMDTMFECNDVTAMFNRKLSKSYFWDWLMPVVDRVEQVNQGVPQQMLHLSLYSTIDEVYQAVVEFIKNLN